MPHYGNVARFYLDCATISKYVDRIDRSISIHCGGRCNSVLYYRSNYRRTALGIFSRYDSFLSVFNGSYSHLLGSTLNVALSNSRPRYILRVITQVRFRIRQLCFVLKDGWIVQIRSIDRKILTRNDHHRYN